jgi:hypothetical protein
VAKISRDLEYFRNTAYNLAQIGYTDGHFGTGYLGESYSYQRNPDGSYTFRPGNREVCSTVLCICQPRRKHAIQEAES